MKKDIDQSAGARLLLTAACFVIVVAGMRVAGPILVPFLLSALIAFICSAPLFWLRRKGVPTAPAVLIIVAGIITIGLLLGILVGTSLEDFAIALPSYQARLEEEMVGLIVLLRGYGVDLSSQKLFKYFEIGKIMQMAASMFSGLGGMLANTFLILLTVIFILLEASGFPVKLRAAFGDTEKSLANLKRVTESIKYYLTIKTATSLATGLCIAIWLAVQGVDFPILWGLLAFLFNYVPSIGPIIAAVPAVLLAFIQLGIGPALFAALGYGVVNIVIGGVIEPRVMGRGVGLSTLVVFISLVFWGWVFGPVGMLLSVPLSITLKIALENNENTHWIAILL